MAPSLEMKAATIRKLLEVFWTRIPCCCTSCGNSDMACCSLFCTCTWAMSGSVPGWKVRVTDTRPEESDWEDM